MARKARINLANVWRIPPMGRKTYVAYGCFAHGPQFPLYSVQSSKGKSLQQGLAVNRTMKVLLGKFDPVIILPEYSFNNSSLQRVIDVGCCELIAIAPLIVAVLTNVTEPIVKKSSTQLSASLRLPDKPYAMFEADVEPPLPKEWSPMNAAAVPGNSFRRMRLGSTRFGAGRGYRIA